MSDDLIEVRLEIVDDISDFVLIIFIDIQDILDVESDKKFGINGDILLARFVSQIGEINKESEERFSDSGKDSYDHQIRIIVFQKYLMLCQRSTKFLADPKIQVIDILFDAIDILLGQLLFECFDEFFMLQVFRDILIDGFDEFAIRCFHHSRNLLSYESFEEFDDFLVLDVQSDVFGVDVLQNRCEEGLIKGLE